MAEEQQELKFWQKSWFMWLCLIFFCPVGIVLCYLNRERHPRWKLICGVFLVLFVIGLAAPKNDTSKTATQNTQTTQTQQKETAAPAPAKKEEPKKEEAKPQVPMEHKMALKAAEQYLRTMPFSKQGLYRQLTADAGNKFPPEAAQYAVDNVKTDWKENAAKAAANYLKIMPMSRDELVQQLTSDAGDQYTLEEAQYGVQKAYQ